MRELIYVILTLVTLAVITVLGEEKWSMSNAQIISETRRCHAAGFDVQRVLNRFTGKVRAITCVEKETACTTKK